MATTMEMMMPSKPRLDPDSKAYKHFCFNNFERESCTLLDTLIKSLPEHCRGSAEAFKRNLKATSLVMTMPVQFGMASLWRRNFDLLLIVERLKRTRKAEAKARDQLLKEMKSKRKAELHAAQILESLNSFLETEEMEFAAAELLRQCAVQLWSALEVFASDIFIALVNAEPQLVTSIMSDEKTRKLFQLKGGVPIEILSDYNFDVGESMGTLLVNYHPIDTIPSMKTVFGVILPNRRAINGALSNKELWLLFQRRHLIVHRRGIVDKAYLSATGEKFVLGEEIHISPLELEKYFDLVVGAGVA